MKQLFLADLKGKSDKQVREHIVSQYQDDGESGYGRSEKKVTEEELKKLLKEYEIIVAYESVGSWGCDSASFFILKNKETGKYYFVSGSHCSCYGFEGQFDPDYMPNEWFHKNENFKYITGGYDDESDDNIKQVQEFIKKNIPAK